MIEYNAIAVQASSNTLNPCILALELDRLVILGARNRGKQNLSPLIFTIKELLEATPP